MKAEHWSLIVSILAFVAAAWAMRYARSQAKSAEGQLQVARQVHREQNEPYVIVDIQPQEPGSFLLVLVIQNVGPTVARNVKIKVTPNLTSTAGDDVGDALAQVLSRTITMMPPGRRLEYLFDFTTNRFGSGLPMVFEFTVNSEGPMGPVEELRYTVDLDVLGEASIGRRPTKLIEERLDKISKGLKGLTDSYQEANRQAITEARDRRMEELRRRREARQQGPNGGSPEGASQS